VADGPELFENVLLFQLVMPEVNEKIWFNQAVR
jgi:hypothetical protein